MFTDPSLHSSRRAAGGSRHAPLLGAIALCSLAACGASEKTAIADSPAATAASASADVAPPVVTITAQNYSYSAPDTIASGMVTLRLVNKGPELHHVQLFRIAAGRSIADVEMGMKMAKAESPPPPWLEPVAGPNSPAPGGEQSLTEELTPGNYAIVCMIPSTDGVMHATKGMVKGLTVIPATGPRVMAPSADVKVVMSDYSWEVSPAITAGKHVIQIENNAAQPHEMFILQLAPGKNVNDFLQWFGAQQGPPPATPMGGISAMPKGAVGYVSVNLPPGEYALMCFLPDAKDGKPHLAHGMVKPFTIS